MMAKGKEYQSCSRCGHIENPWGTTDFRNMRIDEDLPMLSAHVKINLQDMESRFGKAAMARRSHSSMVESVALMKGLVQEGMTVDTGVTRGSVVTSIRGTAVSLRGTVQSAHPSALVMEHGRRPGAAPPPTGPIAAWLSRHGADPKLAFVVARAIGRRGIKATKPFENAVKKGDGIIGAIWRRHFH